MPAEESNELLQEYCVRLYCFTSKLQQILRLRSISVLLLGSIGR